MSQYQHYIPRFLLRNFSYRFQTPETEGPHIIEGPGWQEKVYEGNRMLKVADISSDNPELVVMPVSKSFSENWMYTEMGTGLERDNKIEKKFKKLENDASQILQKLEEAYRARKDGITLSRVEKDKLRKFFFLMAYRGTTYSRKYFCGDPQSYNADDKHALGLYMKERGFATPRSVWLHNLQTILDLDMDPKSTWQETLPRKMFPEDASMFTEHVSHYYMAFCISNEEDAEFILTETCYNVFEGPHQVVVNVQTGGNSAGLYVPYHRFAPLSPRLIITFRSFILPDTLGDSIPEVRELRHMLRQSVGADFPNAQLPESLLADLPIAKATSSYAKSVDGKLEPMPGFTGTFKRGDKFYFRFYPISSKDVDTINATFLDNASASKSVAYGSEVAFRRTLEAYMSLRTDGFKICTELAQDTVMSRRACLHRLSNILKQLGSTIAPVYTAGYASYIRSTDDMCVNLMSSLPIPADESLSCQAYILLGILVLVVRRELEPV